MGDLIERKDAIDAIVRKTIYDNVDQIKYECSINYAKNNDWLGGLKEALEAIEEIPSAEPERKWIPVTGALPEKETDVLVFCKDYFECPNYKELILPLKDVCSKWRNGDNDNTLLEFGCVHGYCGTCDVDNQGSWFPKMRIAYLDNNNEWDGDLSNDEIVVAWMPLPEPWRGE